MERRWIVDGALDTGLPQSRSECVAVARNAAAYDTTRFYHITAAADGLAAVSTPTPRELYVEHLVSQNRNEVDAILGPDGTANPQTLYVGGTYTFAFLHHTATQGYEQLESFLDFPTTVFRIDSVATTYTAPTGAATGAVGGPNVGYAL